MTATPQPGIVGDLRPDLRDTVLRLTDAETSLLQPGEAAALLVTGVFDAGDPECVLVCGLLSRAGTSQPDAEVLVRAAALPVYAPNPSSGGHIGAAGV